MDTVTYTPITTYTSYPTENIFMTCLGVFLVCTSCWESQKEVFVTQKSDTPSMAATEVKGMVLPRVIGLQW